MLVEYVLAVIAGFIEYEPNQIIGRKNLSVIFFEIVHKLGL